jgi:hypothetical protein
VAEERTAVSTSSLPNCWLSSSYAVTILVCSGIAHHATGQTET